MDDGGSVYPRRKRLWIKYKNEDGEWVPQKTPFLDNPEGRKQARALLRKVNARVRAKLAASADLGGGPVTVAKYGLKLAQSRIEQEMPSAFGDKAIFEQHLIPAAVSDDPGHALLGDMLVDEVCPLHVKRIVTGLKKKKSRRGGLLGPRTVCNIYGVLHTMFEHAKIDGLVTANPCVLPEGVLPDREDKDPTWRSTAIFARQEVEQLISDLRVPWDRRVIGGILFVAGTRWGEMAAFQWKDWHREYGPLSMLDLHKSFSFKLKKVKKTKNGKQRLIPVHAVLDRMLTDWYQVGWERMIGRKPTPEDLIVPNAPVLHHSSGVELAPELQEAERERVRSLPPTATKRYRLPSSGLSRFHDDCEALGLRKRRNHDARRTLNSLLIADKADETIRKLIVWGPGKNMSDIYTTLPWESFCEEMVKLRLQLKPGDVWVRALADKGGGTPGLGTRFGTHPSNGPES